MLGLLGLNPAYAAIIKGIDLFGSDDLTAERLIEAEPVLYQKLCQAIVEEKETAQIEQELCEKIQNLFSLSYVNLANITYFNEEGKVVYLTFDVVTVQDAAERLVWKPSPQGTFIDPEGLLGAWDAYMRTGIRLIQTGQMGNWEVKSRAFHSLFGHEHPELKAYEQLFTEGATKHKQDLIQIFQEDQNEHHRAAAAFVLAYTVDGQELADVLAGGIDDCSGEVRNNVLRVYAQIARDHPEIQLPVEQIMRVFHFPQTTDRNKAAAVVYGLISQKESLARYRKILLKEAAPVLLKMLQLKQPNNSDWAYEIFKRLSGLDIPRSNIAGWGKWVEGNLS